MKIDFDPAKNELNQDKHGLRFEDIHLLDWDNVLIVEDNREDYGETRYWAYAHGQDRKAYSVAFTIRGETIRVISFRRAQEKERKVHES